MRSLSQNIPEGAPSDLLTGWETYPIRADDHDPLGARNYLSQHYDRLSADLFSSKTDLRIVDLDKDGE